MDVLQHREASNGHLFMCLTLRMSYEASLAALSSVMLNHLVIVRTLVVTLFILSS